LAIKAADGLLTATADHLAGQGESNPLWILEALGELPLPPAQTEEERKLRKAYQLFQVWLRILRRHDEVELRARPGGRTVRPDAVAASTGPAVMPVRRVGPRAHT
jgi:hypothetical protein